MRKESQKTLKNKSLNNLYFLSSITLICLICNRAYSQVEYILDEDCVYISDGYITSCNCTNNDYIKLVIS